MKTLLLAHTKSSAFFLTLLLCVCVFFATKSFYQETHHFAKKGNAPISLKVFANLQTLKKSPPPPKQKHPHKAVQKSQKERRVERKQEKIAKAKSTQSLEKKVQREVQEPKKIEQERAESEEVEQKEANQEEIGQESVSQEIELIASRQGKHFELYEKVYGAILKNVFYPKKARQRRMSGVVVVEFVLERSGEISQERVVQSSGYALLDESAIKTLNQTQFPTTPKRYRFRVPLRYG